MNKQDKLKIAVFGGGCFWCIEALFERIKGVVSVTSGYAGGKTENPNYTDVCSGTTGHAEVVKIEYDPSIIGYEELLKVFWKAHDPTTLNRQGADVGTQYRSVILYADREQREIAEKSKKELEKAGIFRDPVITEIKELAKFYPAEDYHQDYYQNNSSAGYCRVVIAPKLKKLGIV
jgi:peptide-methionine (S)-S-oxide reductase